MAWPHHVNPLPGDAATAPYNFVPLPQQVLPAAAALEPDLPVPWEADDRYLPGTHSGWIDLDMTTLTPLFIRGPAREGEHGWDATEARLRPDPAMTAEGRPVIPGSSIRGMLRTLVEILAFAKVQPVNEQRPFFRSVGDDPVGRAYRNRMVDNGIKPEGGFVTHLPDGWVVIPAREVLRVPHATLEPLGFTYGPPGYLPTWSLQHHECWVTRQPDKAMVDKITLERQDEWERGTLVLTGGAPGGSDPAKGKKAEFVFLTPANGGSEPLKISEAVWDRFHDDDQISQWQRDAFPIDQPRGKGRSGAGRLRDGEPVFFLRDGETVRFLGRAQMFRFPYDLSLADLVPDLRPHAEVDVAEAMFGRVGSDKTNTVKGRVFVEDAVAVGDREDWCHSVLVPRILSAPKPTTYPHYLTQNGPLGRRGLTTFLEGDRNRTVARGHKIYWHRSKDGRVMALAAEANQQHHLEALGSGRDTQHTSIRPVKKDVTFRGKIRFDNLTSAELGALLAAITLRDDCAHKLGMGKPLGLGSVKIIPALYLVRRAERYRSWSASGATKSDGSQCRHSFEQVVSDHVRQSGETVIAGRAGLDRIARIDTLFVLLSWDRQPRPELTATMALDGFRARKVLPTPHAVAGLPEPDWAGPPPEPAPPENDTTSGRRTAVPRGRAATPPPSAMSKPSVQCIVTDKKTARGEGWIFALPDGRTGVLSPRSTDKSPPDLRPGQEHEMIIVADGDANVQLAWPWAMEEPTAKTAKGGRPGPRGRRGGRKN